MTAKQKVEAYIRSQIPELMELNKGCYVYDPKAIDWARDLEILTYTPKGHVYFREPDGSVFHATSSYMKQVEIIGHPIQLQHWLRVLQFEVNTDKWDYYPVFHTNKLHMVAWKGAKVREESYNIIFDLRTGQPATEADWESLAEILGVK